MRLFFVLRQVQDVHAAAGKVDAMDMSAFIDFQDSDVRNTGSMRKVTHR